MGRTRLLVVEDDEKYIRRADEAAKAVGFEEVEARVSAESSRQYLERGLEQGNSLPDGILLDLDLGYDSGYELLRFWHQTPQLRSIPLVVWSILGPEHAEVCKLFKVNSFVGKWESPETFQDVLSGLVR
jgi:CheY-like chemotaxis protein